MSNFESSSDTPRETRTKASRLLMLGATTCVQLAPPSVDAKSFWPTLAWKKICELFHHGAAKPCVGGVCPPSGSLDARPQVAAESRCHKPRSPTATPDVRLMTSTECTRLRKTPAAFGSGSGITVVQVAPLS